ncbi:MAG: ABC transporter substrate-binding protein [Trichocoleus desertorum ATA4-8-CV12]|jgi:peptide/nickel transport system substrate-binding protein|nr:ABC transporter substrate-binding protein [Trichocoleus desertorum ATA4-8-CV12]
MNWLSLSGRQWRSLGKFLGLFSLCCFLAISCASRQTTQPTGSPAASTNSDRIVLGTTAKVRTLDPADAYDIWAGNLLYNLGDRLYTYETRTTDLKPQLATALPQVSEDGLTYKIPLRQGVVFHDGTPFNAEAMAFSLRRFIENGGQPSFLLSDTVESVEATGENELTIKLKKPFAAFPNLLAFSGAVAVSPKAYEIGEGKFKPSTFVGTGPYKLAQYGTDSLKLDVFDQYWGEKPANQGVDIQSLSSPANLYNAFQTGAVDVAYQNLDLDQIQSLQQGAQRSGWQVIEGRGDGIYYLTLNLQDKPLDQVLVRQALAALVDRPLLQQRVFQGQVEPLYSLIPSSLDAYSPVFQKSYGDGDVAKVKELLAKAGYSKDKPLQLELWYRSNLTSNELVATTLKALAAQRLEGAMTIDLKSVESATAYQNLDKGAYPIFLLDWVPDFLDADNYIQPFLACAKGSEATGCQEGASKGQGSFYYSDRVNQLIDQERQEQDPQARQKIFAEIQNILVNDVPFIPLWQNKEYLFVQKGIEGARLEATQKVPFSSINK